MLRGVRSRMLRVVSRHHGWIGGQGDLTRRKTEKEVPRTGDREPATNDQPPSVQRLVLAHRPFARGLLQRDGEQRVVGLRFPGSHQPPSAIREDAKRWTILPIRQLPPDQRMLAFEIADRSRILSAIVFL